MSQDTLSPAEARAALESADAARAQIAALGVCPPWRHAAFGAIMGLLVGGVGFPVPIQMGCSIAGLAGIAIVASYDRRRYGVFINGYRRGATRPLTFTLLAMIIVLFAVQIWLRERHAAEAVHVAVGVTAFAVATWMSVLWSRVFRREMERRA